MKTKHTPGPWAVESERHDYFIVAQGKTIAEIFSPFGNDCADSRLIAAAPELLESLECIMARPDFDWNIARAAIAKAKGETP